MSFYNFFYYFRPYRVHIIQVGSLLLTQNCKDLAECKMRNLKKRILFYSLFNNTGTRNRYLFRIVLNKISFLKYTT